MFIVVCQNNIRRTEVYDVLIFYQEVGYYPVNLKNGPNMKV